MNSQIYTPKSLGDKGLFIGLFLIAAVVIIAGKIEFLSWIF